jgi:hypothetical protein
MDNSRVAVSGMMFIQSLHGYMTVRPDIMRRENTLTQT